MPDRKRGLLVEPTYGWGEAAPRSPTLREIWIEWLDAINFFKVRARLFPAAYLVYHLVTAVVFACFLFRYPAVSSVLAVMGIGIFIATVYNTVWYHRYCTHRAFKFRHRCFARLFLWTNPVCFREESYVIPHRIHHSKSDGPGDPYGPHLGWLGSYLATESQQKMNLEITRREYDRLTLTLEHIGFVKNSHAAYQRTGSIENVCHYAARTLFANLFWGLLGWFTAGEAGAMGWFAGVFFYSFLVRDFNYRGHGGFFFKASKGLPANQVFYGIIAGEWHDNHHEHPRSARSGREWWQLDVPYLIIRLFRLCRVVVQINESPDKTAATRSASEAEAISSG